MTSRPAPSETVEFDDVSKRIEAAKRNFDANEKLQKGIAADMKYVQTFEPGNGDENRLMLSRIAQLCDSLMTYELRAEQLKKTGVSEIMSLIQQHIKDSASLSPQERTASEERFNETMNPIKLRVQKNSDDANGAIKYDQRWLKELRMLLIRFKLTLMLRSCDEVWKTKTWPHNLSEFDWQSFGSELLAIQHEVLHRMMTPVNGNRQQAELDEPIVGNSSTHSDGTTSGNPKEVIVGDQIETNVGNEPIKASFDDEVMKLSASLAAVRGVHEWATAVIPGAEHMEIKELFNSILHHPEMTADFLDKIPDNHETFRKYLNRAGIHRYNSKGARKTRQSRRPTKNDD